MAASIKNTTNTNTKQEFSPSPDYSIIKQLGSGSFGIVSLAKDNNSQTYFVVKELRKGENKAARAELETCQKAILHPNIVQFYGYKGFVTKHTVEISVFMEYIGNGTLKQRMKNPISERKAFKIVLQIIEAVEELHKRNICHRDLKPDNILLDIAENVKLCDFGLAREILSNADSTKSLAGTHVYMAPEVMLQHYTKKADIWLVLKQLFHLKTFYPCRSIGVIAHELMTGEHFWGKSTMPHIMYKLSVKKVTPNPLPEGTKAEIKDFVFSMLEVEESVRPSARELNELEWVKHEKGNKDDCLKIPFEDQQRIYSLREEIKSIINDVNKIEKLNLAIFNLATILYSYNVISIKENVKELYVSLGIEFPADPDALFSIGKNLSNAKKIYKAGTAFVLAAHEYEGKTRNPDRGMKNCVHQLCELKVSGYENQAMIVNTMEHIVKRMKKLSNLDPFQLAWAYNSIAFKLGEVQRYEEALHYCEKAFALMEDIEDADKKNVFGDIYSNQGFALWRLGRLDEGKESHLKALKIYESAEDYSNGEEKKSSVEKTTNNLKKVQNLIARNK